RCHLFKLRDVDLAEMMHTLLNLFFFQAEDGIRDRNVTGVQTCALPISFPTSSAPRATVVWWHISTRRSPSRNWSRQRATAGSSPSPAAAAASDTIRSSFPVISG